MQEEMYADPTTLQDAAVATGRGTAFPCLGAGAVLFDVSIATTATVAFEAAFLASTANNTETGWTAIDAVARNGGAKATSTTATGKFLVLCSGEAQVRARISAWTAGAVTVKARAIPADQVGAVLADIEVQAAANQTVVGGAAHDAPVSGAPVLVAGKSSAAAPTDVSGDGDATSIWVLRNGAQAAVLTAAGALIGGDATNGLDVDPTRLPAGEIHLGEVGGKLATVTDSFTRPSNTTAYAAKDVVSADPSTIRTFTSIARISGGSGYLVKAQLFSSVAAEVQRMRLHLYNTSSPTVLDDNVANTMLYADAGKYVGFIDFPALATETGSSAAQALWTGAIGFTTSGNANLFGVLETLDAYTPASAATYTIRLSADQN